MKAEDLQRLQSLNRALQHADDEIAKLRSQAERTTTMLDGLPHGSSMRSAIEEAATKLLAKAEEIITMQIEREALRARLWSVTCNLPRDLAIVAELRYADNRSYSEIAKALHCGVRNVFRLHRLALKKIIIR